MVQDCLANNVFFMMVLYSPPWISKFFVPHLEFPSNRQRPANRQFYLDFKQLAIGHFIWISKQSAVGNFISIGNSIFPLKTILQTSKTIRKRGPGPPQNRSQIVQKSLLPGLPLQPTPLAPMIGNLLQTYPKTHPQKALKKSIFSAQDCFSTSKTIRKRGPRPSQNRSEIISYLGRPETQK